MEDAMGQKIRDIMTRNPVMLRGDATVQEAARAMRERDIGSVLVVEDGGKLSGIVTDRDIVVRGVAEGKDLTRTTLREVFSEALAHLTPEDEVDNAIKLMAKKGIRRIPVIEGDRAVGVISLGDLALARDADSALGSISAKSPNN
jgi:CBS domain-containing protein